MHVAVQSSHKRLAAWRLTRTDQNAENWKQPMKNKMMAMSYEDLPRLKKRKPFSLEEERANVFIFGKDEIGLLDIVILDAIAKSEACSR